MRRRPPPEHRQLANLLAEGMVIAGIRFDPGYPVIGLLRSFGPLALRSDASDQVSVSAHEPSQHQAALHGGYIGVRLADGVVIYERLASHDVRCTTSER